MDLNPKRVTLPTRHQILHHSALECSKFQLACRRLQIMHRQRGTTRTTLARWATSGRCSIWRNLLILAMGHSDPISSKEMASLIRCSSREPTILLQEVYGMTWETALRREMTSIMRTHQIIKMNSNIRLLVPRARMIWLFFSTTFHLRARDL